MAQSLEQVRHNEAGLFEPAVGAQSGMDVPERTFDRFGDLYASEERRHRLERTELMIRRAERQFH
jgi:hypothetical protein